jgi:hypothetical protein
MPNAIKYKSGSLAGSISTGNVALGVNESVLGPTETTGWYSGLTPSPSQYVIYEVNSGSVPKIYQPSDDTQLIQFARSNGATGANTGSVASVLNWVASQPDLMIVNNAYPSIVTNELSILMDGGFTPSYPTTGSTWYDLSGNTSNGTFSNSPTFNSNGWINFDGVDDTIFLPPSNVITGNNLQNVTMSTLIKYTSTSTGYVFAIKRSNSDSTLITISINQDTSGGLSVGFLGFLVRNQANTQHNYLVFDNEYNDGKWHQVVARVSGDIRSLFIDGQILLENTGGMQSVTDNTANATIGSFGSNTYFQGSVSSVFFYRRSLSNSEVLQNYYQAPIVTDGVVFAADAGNLVSYESGSSTAYSLTGSLSGSLVNGVGYSSGNGGGWVFDGVNDYIQLPSSLDSLNGNTESSLSIWLKLNSGSNPSGRSGIIQLSGYNNSNGCLYYYTDAARVGGIWLDIFRTNRVFTGDWQPTFDGTLWHNLTVTTTPGTNGWKMYLNGILRFQTTGQNTVSVNSSLFGGFRLGQNSGGRDLWGNISSCFVYNKSLTPEEISQNFNAQRSRFGI